MQCATMEHRRTLTMNWDAIGDDDDDDRFFESYERISSVVPSDLASSGSEDEEFEDSRRSFASCISSASFASVNTFKNLDALQTAQSASVLQDYGLWMSEPGDINERRKRLLQGMGLSSNRNLLKVASARIMPALSRKFDDSQVSQSKIESLEHSEKIPEPDAENSPEKLLVRSRSDGDMECFSLSTKKRKDGLIGPVSKQQLTRTSSLIITPNAGLFHIGNSVRISPQKTGSKSTKPKNGVMSSVISDGAFGSFFLIKNLDTGNEFIVKEFNEQGVWNKFSDLQTGKQLNMEEFEKSVGYSPVVKELMRREDVSRSLDESRKVNAQSYLSKSFRYSKRRGVALLKNIKGVANSMSGLIADKERENLPPLDHQKVPKNSSQWVKVRHQGKSYKEFTALHLCQDIQAHEGSIWTIKFSSDARYLASAGEDRVIHVWEVQECEVMSKTDEGNVGGTAVHPMASQSSLSERQLSLSEIMTASDKKKKGKSSSKKKNNGIPDYASVPDTVFALSEKPFCTFKGHQDDILDLSWSRDLLLLSSSMDKTVRLWDMETKSCLKLFAHNDYVTCIQFNPVDDDYFISGSLDAKVRIWNVPDRQVVDWTDLHEMVTAACYTPNGQGAIIGSHKGSCRLYSIEDCKLEQKDLIDVRSKKKTQAKKVTGIQCGPSNPDEMLITTADSRIRIVDGTDVTHKFKGFRNTSSQISASYSPEGKFIITASEDHQVYIWKREEPKHHGTGKGKTRILTQAHEHFQCRDVSVAIPWPGSIKNEPPIVELHSKRHSKRCTSPSQSPSQSAAESPPRDDNAGGLNSKRHLPPLPKKNNAIERSPSGQDEDFHSSRMDPGIGASESFSSASGSDRYGGDSSSLSASGSSRSQSWSSSWSLFDGGASHGGHTIQATAWGMVIVTATLGGEIRVYQNFGLPIKIGRQPLFKDLT